MEVDAKIIFYSVIGFILLESLWEFYLMFRQIKVYYKHTEIPTELNGILTPKTFEKARLYALDKCKFSLVDDSVSLVFSIIFLFLNGLPFVWNLGGVASKRIGFGNNELMQSTICILFMNVVSTICNLPFSIYYTFVLEEKHGFNKQTFSFFIRDNVKKFILNQVIILPLSCGIIYIVKIGGDYFFIYLWVFVTVMSLFLYTIYPDYIAPLFDKYTPLPEGELKVEIEKLAASIGFPLYKLYVVEGSKRSAHSNAYFYGLFKNKRIVLFDTLLQDYTPENETKDEKEKVKNETEKKGCNTPEVLAVLCHELGHWKLNHVMKNIIIAQINLILLFSVFGMLFKYDVLYQAFGFHDSKPILIGLVIVLHFVCLPYFEILSCLVAIMSRRFEFQADHFAKKMGRANHLRDALIKLNADNLSFPIYDPLYSMWHHSHPPLLERLQAIDKEE